MKTLLIVEDERLIRRELRIMSERSGVPIGKIIECSSGEEAFEVLRNQNIDVMMTDINMDGMSGIELVKKMQELPHQPLTFAVSGYDEFTYAVEMMHYGVRGYILKPVEQEKISEFLRKFEAEIESEKAAENENRENRIQRLKYFLLNDLSSSEEIPILKKQFFRYFPDGYYICCTRSHFPLYEEFRGIVLDNIEDSMLVILDAGSGYPAFMEKAKEGFIGISRGHQNFCELHSAYEEALSARKTAFCQNRQKVKADEAHQRIPEALLQDAGKLLTEEAETRRVNVVGAAKEEEMAKYWNQFFQTAKSGRISPDEFAAAMISFFSRAGAIYKNVAQPEEFQGLKSVFSFSCLDEYSEIFMHALQEFHDRIKAQVDFGREKRKIIEAVGYIRENYAKDLNMAVVSNYVQMNYSLFSFAFKQYTGSNFVNYLRDLRMEEAKKLLKETDIRINEISERVGYSNPKHFMKTFKGLYGVSPSEFRSNSNI